MTDSLNSVAELIANGNITDVRVTRLVAETRDEPNESISETDVLQEMQLGLRIADDIIEFRVDAVVDTRMCHYEVTAATQATTGGITVSEETSQEFASRVGFTVVYPYIREAIQSASTRLRHDNVVMPLVDPDRVQLRPVDRGAEGQSN